MPARAHAVVRAAVAGAVKLAPGLALFAGGKSFGGRMTSQTQAISPMPGVCGLVFLGFPLHAANKPATVRADHLRDIAVPMLFVQGTRDALAEADLIAPVVEALGATASLEIVEGADHSFHAPKRSGRTDEEALAAILDAVVGWMERVIEAG